MPIAIIISNNAIPAIIEEQTDHALLKAVNALAITPHGLNLDNLQAWLASRPRPSGWYETRTAAETAAREAAYLHRRAELPLAPEAIKDARMRLGMSRVEFGAALGFNGNPNTVNKAIYTLETNADRPLRREKQEILFGLLTDMEFAKA